MTKPPKPAKKAASPSPRPSPPWAPDADNPTARHRLEGLEPDNLLAVMALIGLLRALEEARPDWAPRAFWDVDAHPWRPVLTLAQPQTQAAVADAAAEGVKRLGAALEAICELATAAELAAASAIVGDLSARESELNSGERKALDKARKRAVSPRELDKVTVIARNAEDLREQLSVQNPVQLQWVAALAGFALSQKREPGASASLLMLTSGQQAFGGLLRGLTAHADGVLVARSLYQPWLYKHRGDSLRLSPVEARRYAYMAGDPTVKKPKKADETGCGVAPSELGANMLAALGFLSLPTFTTAAGCLIPGVRASTERTIMRWPVWISRSGRGARLSGIEALLRQAALPKPVAPLEVHGWQDFDIFQLAEDSATLKYKSVAALPFVPIRSGGPGQP
jgi:hypothetical protein